MDPGEYRTEVDNVSFLTWSEWIDRFEDANIYQTWPYGSVRWGEGALSHLVLFRGESPVAMAQLRIVRPGRLNCGIAYLRWGPLMHLKDGVLDEHVAMAMAKALHAEYVEKRRLFLRIVPNAFDDTLRANIFKSAFEAFGSETARNGDSRRTLIVDLSESLDSIRKDFDQKWRNQLNRAEKNGLIVDDVVSPKDFQHFAQMYQEMWSRKKFQRSSDIHEFWDMQQQLPPSQQLKILLCKLDGVPVAGYMGTGLGDTGIYLFGATSNQGLQSKGSYLMQWTMIKWLKEKGIRYYDLGGINPRTNPGVYHFKKGLSGVEQVQLNPFVSCKNGLSRFFARTTDIMNGRIRSALNQWIRRK